MDVRREKKVVKGVTCTERAKKATSRCGHKGARERRGALIYACKNFLRMQEKKGIPWWMIKKRER